jgi:hypothetical protein
MSPALEPGSVAINRQVPTSDLSPADAVIIPLPDTEGQRYLHRLIDVKHPDSRENESDDSARLNGV